MHTFPRLYTRLCRARLCCDMTRLWYSQKKIPGHVTKWNPPSFFQFRQWNRDRGWFHQICKSGFSFTCEADGFTETETGTGFGFDKWITPLEVMPTSIFLDDDDDTYKPVNLAILRIWSLFNPLAASQYYT